MDEDLENINHFESILKARSSKKPLALYATENHNRTLNTSQTQKVCSAKDVLLIVSKQLKAIQSADRASCNRVGNKLKLEKYKKGEFLPVMIPVYKEVPKQIASKLETQCVSDTQLINVIENAEIVHKHGVVTQEFDETFCQNSDDDQVIVTNEINVRTNTIVDKCEDVIINSLNDQDSKLFESSAVITSEMDTVTCHSNDIITDCEDYDKGNTSLDTQGLKKCVSLLEHSEEDRPISHEIQGLNKCVSLLEQLEEDRPTSPILNTNKRNSTPPLVVSLYTFEEFEDLAHPIIEKHEDLNMAKNLINSQIIGREVFITDQVYENMHRQSPVLNKIECITSDFNKNSFENIDAGSPKCIERDKKVKIEPASLTSSQSNCYSENKILTTKLIKTEIEDEILFSSDEENEYLNKEVQELPLTCALETSFYDKSGILDKTMYVGFQTASNKSIQINTESFTKAKSILSGIDVEESGISLKELVDIFDSGKDVHEPIQSNELRSSKRDLNTDNKCFSKECDDNMLIASANVIKSHEQIGNTFQNISLTALERDVNDEIVMSQIIESKIIPRTAKANNSIKLEDKMSDTLSNVNLTGLEQEKENDDIVMSQVIEFKSIARTPRLKTMDTIKKGNVNLAKTPETNENMQNTDVIEVFKNPINVISKRKFEGFKTASNKKIKLTNEALAQCKKIFHDINLDDAEQINIDPNKGLNTCSIAVNTGINLSPKIIQNENKFIPTSLSNLADTNQVPKRNDYSPKIDPNLAKKRNIEKLDIHIDDEALLQEFEDNEMPFGETNNNAYVGFKTASNKNIAVSGDGLAKTKHLFHDIMTINADSKSNNDDSDQMSLNKPTIDSKTVTDELTKVPSEPAIENKTIANNASLREKNEPSLNINQTHKPARKNFVGFKTAANRDIKISDQAKQKAKQLYEDMDKELEIDLDSEDTRHSNTEKKIDNNVRDEFNCGIDTQDFLAQDITHIEDLIMGNSVQNKNPANPTFQGFQTASKKTVLVSKAALEKAAKLFEDITNKECNLLDLKDDNTDNNKKPNGKNKSVDFKGNNNALQFKDLVANKNKETSIFKGFQTASNKTIPISHKAMQATRKIFQDIELFNLKPNDAREEFKNEESVKLTDKTNSNLDESIQSSKVTEKSDLKDITIQDRLLSGFKTASEKPIHISTDSINKTKQMLNEFEHEKDNLVYLIANSKPISSFAGFQTANNKEVKVSAEALAKSKQILKNLDSEIDNNVPPKDLTINSVNDVANIANDNNDDANTVSNFVGFQTASNKKVTISNEALATSRKIFEDITVSQKESESSKEKEETRTVFKGFQTANNKKVNISEKALKSSKKLFSNIESHDCRNNEKPKETLTFQGFQTASNKHIQISEKALAKCKQLFEDINLSQLVKDSETKPIQSDHTTEVNEDVLAFKKPSINDKDDFQGFQSARNNKVSVSEKASAKNEEIYDDVSTNYYNNDKLNKPTFEGFQTASNRQVKISEQALAKSRQLFGDIALSHIEKESGCEHLMAKCDLKQTINNENSFKGFQTASNKKVKVSQQALAKTKDIFKDIHENEDTGVETHNPSKVNSNFEFKSIEPISNNVIDTQVLNDFRDELNTENFRTPESTPKSKRSGSPILSCPRAKKRRFETPYSTIKKKETISAFIPPKVSKTYTFAENYKKHKKYNLRDIEKLEKEHDRIDIDPYIAEFNFDNLLNFEFDNERNDYTDKNITMEEIKKIFLDSVNKRIVPDGWIDNHLKLIIWKLLSYEVRFPNVMRNTCTVRNVLEQLKYRYDKELYHFQRPILRKVLEKDEAPSKTMVLCVAGFYVDNIRVISVPTSSHAQNVELLLTDGWYCVKAILDRMLVDLVTKGHIVVGTKLIVSGAELINCEQGIAPWEDTSSVRVKLSGNSVSMARRGARLGLRARAPPRSLRRLRLEGGAAHATRAGVVRVYPRLFVEKMADGSAVTRSERLEQIYQSKYETERQALMEKLYEELEKELSDQDSQDSEGCSNERNCMESGSQISKCIKKSKDPDEFRAHLTKSQARMLEEHNARQREKLIERVRLKLQHKLEESGIKERNVVPLLKVRLAGLPEDGPEVAKALLSIWRPSAAVLEMVTEGAWIEIRNVIPTGTRNNEIQLSAGRQTVFNPYKHNDKYPTYNPFKRKCYEIKEIALNPALTTDYNEIDTVGIIFSIEPSTKEFKEKENFQNVYLADADKNIICVNFWGGLKKFGFENILDTGQIVTCVNLQKRAGNTRKSIPDYRATEFSYFTKTPKDKKAMEISNELSNKLSKIKEKFCEDCALIKSNYSALRFRNNENVSPYNFNQNTIPRNIASPLKNDINLNLTGLDFESSFDHVSPQALLRKKRVNEKIEKIRLNYGEPPPLSSIHIINKSKNASATYKSPLVSNLEGSNVASAETPATSSVSLNRTYVKSINPVKLNFSGVNDVDHFAEDFEASPPLSLDSDTVN